MALEIVFKRELGILSPTAKIDESELTIEEAVAELPHATRGLAKMESIKAEEQFVRAVSVISVKSLKILAMVAALAASTSPVMSWSPTVPYTPVHKDCRMNRVCLYWECV